jgi:O-antigen/teichoic acid export membrane protein
LELSWRLVNRRDISHLLSLGGAVLAVSLSSIVIEQTDRLVVAAFLPIADVTHYAAAWKIYMLAFALTTTVVQAMSPVSAELFGRADHSALTALFLRTTKYSLILAWPLVLSLGFTGGFLLHIWMGDSYVSSLAVIQVLLFGFIVTAHNHAGYSALMGMRRVGPTVWRYFVPQAVLNLAFSILLIRRFGITGVAFGTMMPAVALEGLYLGFMLPELGVTWKDFVQQVVVPVATPALLAFGPLAFVYSQLDHRSAVLPLVAVCCGVIYAVLIWRRLDMDERSDVVAYVPSVLRRRMRVTLSPQTVAIQPGESH